MHAATKGAQLERKTRKKAGPDLSTSMKLFGTFQFHWTSSVDLGWSAHVLLRIGVSIAAHPHAVAQAAPAAAQVSTHVRSNLSSRPA